MKNSRRWFSLFVVIGLIALVPLLTGVAKGKTTIFKDTKALGPVTFDGTSHAGKGLKCTDCHTKLFAMKAGTTPKADLTMAAMRQGKTCGACHDGKKAFGVAGDCMKCHAKKK